MRIRKETSVTMNRVIDMEQWERKVHFQFFRGFDDPYFGVCTEVDCTASYREAKERSTSFFLLYLHKSLTAAHRVEEFRYRIAGEDVVCYDTVRASPTVNRENGTFGIAYIDYHEDFDCFAAAAREELEQVKSAGDLVPSTHDDNVIHYSTLPWIRFTGLTYPRSSGPQMSIPRITFGKYYHRDGSMFMPLDIQVHHGLMDGLHVGSYIDSFQELLDRPV